MMKHYIKLGLWIFILSVLYASGAFGFFGFSAKLPLVFSLIYGLYAKSFREKLTVACICGVILSALGGDYFVMAVLCSVYGTLIISAVFSDKLLKYARYCVILICLIMFIYEMIMGALATGFEMAVIKGSVVAAGLNLCFAAVMYPAVRYSFSARERYIF